ncbi:class I SAM-dependent methyltransferase [Tabrizicola sp. BL-A-41-H6]|uniref:class I SAM-dependent methyltransferase n=1 Tax=Tabrizicola sp. BL-A-41-H6 TaxID=3421107 RepID=UPI003D664349
MADPVADPGYETPGKLELIWGEGFMSPGGPAEVARIVGGRPLDGCEVLDIGCGLGGADIALVVTHGAASVTGIDVQAELIEGASHRVARQGLSERIRFVQIVPGPLPFANESFDVVFSKDALLHVADKAAIYREAFRVLRPGGRLMVSDWLRGQGDGIDGIVDDFVAAAGHAFHMVTLPQISAHVAAAGFTEVETEDRGMWYLGEAKEELERLGGALGDRFADQFGAQALADETEFWRVLVRALDARAMSPGHIRATKPG